MSANREMLFTFIACTDLKRIWDSIAIPTDVWAHTGSDNLSAAQRFSIGFEKHCELLKENPEVGVQREELMNELRSSTYQKYVIFYRVRGPRVEIMRVLRRNRDMVSLE
jgi:plasmid stabilization system protein ParE